MANLRKSFRYSTILLADCSASRGDVPAYEVTYTLRCLRRRHHAEQYLVYCLSEVRKICLPHTSHVVPDRTRNDSVNGISNDVRGPWIAQIIFFRRFASPIVLLLLFIKPLLWHIHLCPTIL